MLVLLTILSDYQTYSRDEHKQEQINNIPLPNNCKKHIPPTNHHLLAAEKEPYRKKNIKKSKYWWFLEKKVRTMDRQQIKDMSNITR